ncbi:MAG: RNA methyltransferase, partial [Clostridia bacterium]|nr:RNA methyltransferase [Clostridia bacterium]
DESGEFIVEGAKSVLEAVSRGFTIDLIAATVKGAALVSDLQLTPELLSDDVFKAVSEEVSPQGVLARVKKTEINADDVTEKCVFLDGVSDPANVGAIVRSAAAFGYNTVLIADGADAYSNKAVRASMGGIFRVKVLSGTRAETLEKVKVPIIVADMGGETLGSLKVPEKHCLCIGNEAHGVSEELKSLAKIKIAIPMQNGMESLNAAVSAGILMYALNH